MRLFTHSLPLVLLAAAAMGQVEAANIIWVSEARSPALASAYSTAAGEGWNIQNPGDATPYDQGWIDLLAADGHTIDYRTNATTGDPIADWQSNGYWQGTLSQTQKDELNAADLIIVSPDFNGTQYNPGDTGRLDWNALETPLLSLTPQTMTTDVWHWTSRDASGLIDFNLLSNGSSGRPDRVSGLPDGGNNTQPAYMRVRSLTRANLALRSSNDTVQWDILDETAGSQQLQYLDVSVPDLVYGGTDNIEGTLDWSRTFASTGDTYVDDTYWRSETQDTFVYEARWEAGQEWCPSCDPGVTPAPAGARQMFNAATVANPDVGGFFEGAGQEVLSTAGEAIFLDGVNRLAATNDPSQLRQNRMAPLYTPTIDGVVTPQEMQAQLRVPMTVARDGVAPADWMRGGTVLESSNAQNGVLDEGGNANFESCVQCGFDPAELSANWYVSWDADQLYISAVVKDNSPFFAMTLDSNFVFDANSLPHDAVGFLVNPNNNTEGATARYSATVASDQPGPTNPPSMGPSINRNGGVTSFAALEQDGVQIEGEQTTDEQEQIDGYVLEMALPWDVVMVGAGGDSYVPAAGDQHGLSFFMGGWNGFQGGGGTDAANRRSLILDYAYGDDQHERSVEHPGIDVFDPNLWNLITLVSADFNGDNQVDGADFLAIQRSAPGLIESWEAAYGTTSSAAQTTIPEPASAALVAVAACLAAGCRRRRGVLHPI